jgi:ATP-dependent helicase/nuclease subunit A
LFQVLACPSDRFELIGVLREIFGVSDAEIAKVHQSQMGLDLGKHAGGAGYKAWARCTKALNLLQQLRQDLVDRQSQSDFSLSSLVDHVLQIGHLKERITAVGEDPTPLDFLRHDAQVAEAEGKTLAAWIREQRMNLVKAPLLTPGNPDEIQLLTSQKSKGLEWPVVLVLGLGRVIGSPKVSYPLIERSGDRFQVHFNGMTSDEEAKEKLKSLKEQELQRLFYVMLTRAKNVLVIPDSHGFYKLKTPSFTGLSRWESVQRVEMDLFTLPQSPPGNVDVVKKEECPVSCDDMGSAIAAANIVPLRILPHELVIPDEPRGEREVTPLLTGVGGMDYGTWWHGVLQRYPWKSDYQEQQKFLDRSLEDLDGNSGWRQRGKEELDLWQASEARRELLKQAELFLPELPFLWPQSEMRWMEGVADLVLVGRDGHLSVLDWKTNRLHSGETEERYLQRLADIYTGQLQAYSRMLESVSGRQVANVWIYATVNGRLLKL